MIQITDKKKCCGCTACASICPKKCITMEPDEEGFVYPLVDISKCVSCNLCNAVCPLLKDEENVQNTVLGYAIRDKRPQILKNGTSGGIFYAMMEDFLSMNGVVYGVVVGNDNVVKHVRIDNIDDELIKKIPNSKYVRSDIGGIYIKIREDLLNGKKVLFSGTPCQAAGLKCFLQKEYENLLVVDVICRGTPSPKFWNMYVLYQERKYRSPIIDVKFRNKTYGYHSSTMKLTFKNGKVYTGSARVDIFLKSFFKDLCSRPSCYECKFKNLHHASDITMFDCWHFQELTNVKDDNLGYTNVIVQSKNGQKYLEKLSENYISYNIHLEKAVDLDGIMVFNSVKWRSERDSFFKNIDDANFEKSIKKYICISAKDRFIEKAKKLYYAKRNIK